MSEDSVLSKSLKPTFINVVQKDLN